MTIEAPEILLVTTGIDIASDYVADALTRVGARHFRLNTEELPLGASSSAFFSGSRLEWSWRSSSSTVIADSLRAVWFRRLRQRVMPSEMIRAHAEYCLRESDWFLRGVLFSLEQSVPESGWMSHPLRVQRAESKIEQLCVAQQVGLKCPQTLISNNPSDIREFFANNSGRIVAKPLRLGYFDYGDVQTCVYTTEVHEGDLLDDSSLSAAPVIYQEHLRKLCDVRVTIVGDIVFSAAIHSQQEPSAEVDWRRCQVDLAHSRHDLPVDVESACLKFVSRLGLTYGALDFVLTPEGQYYFLEINPNGQWVWIEDKLGFPISSAIASWLVDQLQ